MDNHHAGHCHWRWFIIMEPSDTHWDNLIVSTMNNEIKLNQTFDIETPDTPNGNKRRRSRSSLSSDSSNSSLGKKSSKILKPLTSNMANNQNGNNQTPETNNATSLSAVNPQTTTEEENTIPPNTDNLSTAKKPQIVRRKPMTTPRKYQARPSEQRRYTCW